MVVDVDDVLEIREEYPPRDERQPRDAAEWDVNGALAADALPPPEG